jgi:hypothetical protein
MRERSTCRWRGWPYSQHRIDDVRGKLFCHDRAEFCGKRSVGNVDERCPVKFGGLLVLV